MKKNVCVCVYVTESLCCTAEINTSLEVYFKEKKKNLYSFLKSLNPLPTYTHNSPTPLYIRTSPFTYTFSLSLSLLYIHNYSVGFSMEWLLPCELYPFKFLPTLSSLGLTTIAAAAAKSLQSCPTLRDPTDGSPPGFPVPGILQARILEWVAISFSNA